MSGTKFTDFPDTRSWWHFREQTDFLPSIHGQDLNPQLYVIKKPDDYGCTMLVQMSVKKLVHNEEWTSYWWGYSQQLNFRLELTPTSLV